jgi:hypothetical protein
MLDSTYLNMLIVLVSAFAQSVLNALVAGKLVQGSHSSVQLPPNLLGVIISICLLMINMFSVIVTLALYKVPNRRHYSFIILPDSSRV